MICKNGKLENAKQQDQPDAVTGMELNLRCLLKKASKDYFFYKKRLLAKEKQGAKVL